MKTFKQLITELRAVTPTEGVKIPRYLRSNEVEDDVSNTSGIPPLLRKPVGEVGVKPETNAEIAKPAAAVSTSTPVAKPTIVSAPTPEPTVINPQSKVIKMGPSDAGYHPNVGNANVQRPSPTYTVGERESLSKIAAKHGVSVQDIMKMNKGIKDPNNVPAGTKIRTR